MRVLHIGEICGYGGVETVLADLIGQQRKDGIDADIFYFSDAGGAELYDGVCEVYFAGRQSLAELLLVNDYDVIHVISAAANSAEISVRKAKFAGAAVVTCHGAFRGCMGSEHVTAVSQYTAAQIQGHCSAPVQVVYNGVDTGLFCPTKREAEDKPIIAWVGRSIDPYKDVGGLFALAGSELGARFRFVVVDGSQEDWEMANWLPAGSEVRNRMSRQEMADLYRRVAASRGCVLSTSRLEACPMNVLEAQACGCPVIAPAVGGIPEIVRHKSTGYLYERRDGLQGLRGAFDWLYSGGTYDQASQAASSHITQNHSLKAMADGYAQVYEAAIGERHPSLARGAARLGLSVIRSARRLVRGEHGGQR